MLFGTHIFITHIFTTQFSFQPDEFTQAAEEHGLDSVWFSEHSHVPVSVLNADVLPDHLWQTYDIFVAMTLAAAVTENIKVGTGISLANDYGRRRQKSN